ncbi:MAG: hypothetical protein ACK5N8_08045 [Alphaproteobacteria bacterium]
MENFYASVRNMFLFLAVVILLILLVVHCGESFILSIAFLGTLAVGFVAGVICDSIRCLNTKGLEKVYSFMMMSVQLYCIYFVIILFIQYLTSFDAISELDMTNKFVKFFILIALGIVVGIRIYLLKQKK